MPDVLPGFDVKAPGRHRWCLSAVYPLKASQASAVASGAAFKIDPEKLLVVPVVTCFDCNGHYDEMRSVPCPIDPE